MARTRTRSRSATGARAEPGRVERSLVGIVRIALVLALAVPLIVMGGRLPEILYPYITGKALYFRLMVEIALAAWLFLIFRYPEYRPARSWVLACLIIYLLAALLASFAGVSLARSLWSNYERMQGWFSLAHYTAFALMLASVMRTYRHWWCALNINLLVGFVVGLLGLYEISTGSTQRLSVTFGNPSFLASYALVNCFVAAAFLARSLVDGRASDTAGRRAASPGLSEALLRSFWVAVICLDLLMLNYTGTRGAVVGLAAGIAIISAAGAPWRAKWILKVTCFSALIALLVLATGFLLLRDTRFVADVTQLSPTLRRFVDITPESEAVQSRINATQIGLEAFSEKPVLGWGPENFASAYDSLVAGEAAAGLNRFDQAHNRLVEELVTAGVIGLVSYAVVWLSLFWLLVGRIGCLTPGARLFILFIGAGLAAYFVQNLFLFDTVAASVQLYLLVGFVLHFTGAPLSSALEEGRTPRAIAPPSRGKTDRIRFRIAESATAKAAIAITIVVAALGTSYLMVVGPYIGAASTFHALSGARTAEQRFAAYQRAISASPALATETVLLFAKFIIEHWESLSAEERRTALGLTTRDAEAGLAREPSEWRLHLALAELYKLAYDEDPGLAALAREHTNAAEMIAPGRVEVLEVRVRQHILEGDDEAALDLIQSYLEHAEPYLKRDSTVYRGFDDLRTAIKARQ